MEATFATKITKNIFCYHLVGLKKNILYDTTNRSLIFSCALTGAPLEIVEKDEDLDFETFVLIARNIFLDILETFD